ncbi:hypothetical protein [Terricaulis silvestris]|uniref:PRC-barrel domain protein n=1 Tax=Terricaulis silvestris TaxID=2686094 RepID=A0A6I6MTF5_9CAUL|nr:hypothetical protein [Terricaulis silvestris]QGZ94423.1 hypothetical protein DSM104635_01241 [Terricaulis silvestris]
MLRTLVITLALGLPGVAAAQQAQFNDSAVGIEVRGDDGTVVGRVNAVQRDANGRIVAVEIAGQEPGSAPYAASDLVADRRDGRNALISDRQRERSRVASSDRTATR